MLLGKPVSIQQGRAGRQRRGRKEYRVLQGLHDLLISYIRRLGKIEFDELRLQYATMWKAVVLMDEADVFLEARDDHGDNSTQNALVAGMTNSFTSFI